MDSRAIFILIVCIIPSMETRVKIEPTQSMAYFKTDGQIATSLTLINIKSHIPIQKIVLELEKLLNITTNETINKATAWVQNRTIAEFNILATELRQYTRELKDVAGLSKLRPKRQIAAGIGMIGGWAFKSHD
eukprot:TRINITY_DN1019_c0_g2_i1.p2 TRINITY_DN1019_c0_g2~~TRINITY_DN1019_c0_g2_i1.p2  ORF type:complete len:133 (+),score=20.55 TRINITY_DN1019_c0_g2_i1:750-1148(+)